MTNFAELLKAAEEASRERPIWEGVITTSGVNDPGDHVYVAPIEDRHSPDGPARWEPRIEPNETGGVRIRYPARGDKAAVVESTDGKIWILGWWPYE